MTYKILTENSTRRLEGAVHFALRSGATLVGGPFVSTRKGYDRPDTTEFHQAIMEPEDDE